MLNISFEELNIEDLDIDKAAESIRLGDRGRYQFTLKDGRQVSVLINKERLVDLLLALGQKSAVAHESFAGKAPRDLPSLTDAPNPRTFRNPELGQYGGHENVAFKDKNLVGYWCAAYELDFKRNSEAWEFATWADIENPWCVHDGLVPGESAGTDQYVRKNELVLLINTKDNIAKLEAHWRSLQHDPMDTINPILSRGGMVPYGHNQSGLSITKVVERR